MSFDEQRESDYDRAIDECRKAIVARDLAKAQHDSQVQRLHDAHAVALRCHAQSLREVAKERDALVVETERLRAEIAAVRVDMAAAVDREVREKSRVTDRCGDLAAALEGMLDATGGFLTTARKRAATVLGRVL